MVITVSKILLTDVHANIPFIKSFICPTNAHNSYKIVKLLKSFKIIIVAPACFGLHKPSSGSSQLVLRQSYNVDIGYISLFEVIGTVVAYFLVLLCVWIVPCVESSIPHSTHVELINVNKSK